jgi:hypothetical protein
MRVTITKAVGSQYRAGDTPDVPDEVAMELVRYGYATADALAEVPLPSVGGPGFVAGSEILVPQGGRPAWEAPERPAPRPGTPTDSPDAVGRGKLERKEQGG